MSLPTHRHCLEGHDVEHVAKGGKEHVEGGPKVGFLDLGRRQVCHVESLPGQLRTRKRCASRKRLTSDLGALTGPWPGGKRSAPGLEEVLSSPSSSLAARVEAQEVRVGSPSGLQSIRPQLSVQVRGLSRNRGGFCSRRHAKASNLGQISKMLKSRRSLASRTEKHWGGWSELLQSTNNGTYPRELP